jgi:hypothetical protein
MARRELRQLSSQKRAAQSERQLPVLGENQDEIQEVETAAATAACDEAADAANTDSDSSRSDSVSISMDGHSPPSTPAKARDGEAHRGFDEA